MLAAVTNVQRLDWGGWVRGFIGAIISGGAGAVASGFGASMADPAHDINIFKVMGFTFIISGVVSLAKFLQTSPVPAPAPASAALPPSTKLQ
jgi:hypothetical protein